MAKYKLQEMPDVHHDGKKRVYPKMVANRQLDTKEFVKKMHLHNHVFSENVVTAVLTASLELKKLTHGKEALFQSTGSGSHKVWMGKKEVKNSLLISRKGA